VDVAEWLRSLGLTQYEQAFHDNAVDAETLPRLTSDDLKELGVHAVGHRRKLLDAIAHLNATPLLATGGGLSSTERSAAQSAVSPPLLRSGAERRQLTVMFCDLVGSTALASTLDPEEYRAILSAYHGTCAETIAKFGGFVAKYMGMECSRTSAIRRPMRMMPPGPSALDWP
jgi:class 3 adenylate cyclase